MRLSQLAGEFLGNTFFFPGRRNEGQDGIFSSVFSRLFLSLPGWNQRVFPGWHSIPPRGPAPKTNLPALDGSRTIAAPLTGYTFRPACFSTKNC